MNAEVLHKPAHLINRAARSLQRLGDARFQAMGLAMAQVPVLGALSDGTSKSQIELARLANVEQPTMAQLLVRMERDGLIQRTPNPIDRRGSLIKLTAKAMRVLPRAKDLLLEGNKVALKGFTERDIVALTNLLKRVNLNIDDYRSELLER